MPEVHVAPPMIDQILAGAERAFLAQGYDLTTMDSVARHAGVARGSVYNHFDSKEALFLAMMKRGIAAFVGKATCEDDPRDDPMDRLARVAACFLRAAVEPEAMEMYRTIIALRVRFPDLAASLYTVGLAEVAKRLGELASLAGVDRVREPGLFAQRLMSLMMGGYFQRKLLGIVTRSGDGAVEDHVRGLIDALACPA